MQNPCALIELREKKKSVLVNERVMNYNLLTQTFFEFFQGMEILATSFPS